MFVFFYKYVFPMAKEEVGNGALIKVTFVGKALSFKLRVGKVKTGLITSGFLVISPIFILLL